MQKIGIIDDNIVNTREALISRPCDNLLNLYTMFKTHQKVATLSSKIPLQIGKILCKTF